MDKKQELDEMDKLLLEYYKNKRNSEYIVPPSTQRIAQKFIRKVKMQNAIRKFNKVAAIFITIGVMTTGIVFAKDIINFITSLFTNSTPAIEKAVENGYVQNIDMDYVYSNNIGIRVEYLLIDDFNLDVSFAYECENENVNLIEIDQYSIETENDKLIYDSSNKQKEKIPLSNYIIRNNPTQKVDNKKYRESILFNLTEHKNDFNNLRFNINSLKIINQNNTVLNLLGHWNFIIELNDNMKKNNNITYNIINKENVVDFSAVMNSTGLVIKIKTDIPLENEQLKDINNFILKNSVEEEFMPYSVKNSKDGMITIQYNNISKYSDNIEKLILYLKVNNNKVFELKLHKID